MPKPQNFIFSTDYPTLKQQNSAASTSVLAGSQVIPANGTWETHGDATVGTIGSLFRTRISSDYDGSVPLVGDAVVFPRTGIVAGSPAAYSLLAIVYRISATQLRFQCYVQNPYSQPLTTQSGTNTVIISTVCFLAPYA